MPKRRRDSRGRAPSRTARQGLRHASKKYEPGKSRTVASATPERRALDVVAAMRHGKSLSHAARQAHTTPATVRKYAGTAIARLPEGNYAALAHDRIARPMKVLTPNGVIALDIRSSTSASRIGEYWNAVDRYLRTGRADALRSFRGKRLRAGRTTHQFVTDLPTLDRLANAGEVRFEEIYEITT